MPSSSSGRAGDHHLRTEDVTGYLAKRRFVGCRWSSQCGRFPHGRAARRPRHHRSGTRRRRPHRVGPRPRRRQRSAPPARLAGGLRRVVSLQVPQCRSRCGRWWLRPRAPRLGAELVRPGGWWGHDPATRFDMPFAFTPVAGADGWQVPNPPILSMAPVRVSLELFDRVGMDALRSRSVRLTGFLERMLARGCHQTPSRVADAPRIRSAVVPS